MLRPVPLKIPPITQDDLENIATWQSQIERLREMKARVSKRVLQQLADGAEVEPGPRHATSHVVQLGGVSYEVLEVDGRRCYIYAEGGLHDLIAAMSRRFPE